MSLAIPTVAIVVILIALSVPHLSIQHLEGHHGSFGQTWTAFVGVSSVNRFRASTIAGELMSVGA